MADDPGLADVAEPEHPLRIAVSVRPPLTGLRADLEHLRAVVRTARALEAEGHVVSRVDPPYSANPVPELARWFGGASHDAEGLDRSLLDPAVRAHVRIGDQVRRRGLVRDADREARQAAMAEFFAAYDLLLTPVLAQPPIAAARWGTRPWPRVVNANARYAPVPRIVEHRAVPGGVGPGRHPSRCGDAAGGAGGRPHRRRVTHPRAQCAGRAPRALAPARPRLLTSTAASRASPARR